MRFALLAIMLVGCGGPTSGSPDAAAAADDAAEPIDAAVDPALDAAPFSCATSGAIHLAVHPVDAGPIPDGRLVVVFYQMVEVLQVPLHVGYDVAVDGDASVIDVTLADITLPPVLDDYRLCPRTCFDLTDPTCDCPAAEAKLGLAFVMVLGDLDGSGAIEPAELTQENRYGVGVLQLGESDDDYAVPNALDELAPEGIQGCFAPYEILPPTGGEIFDDLGIPATDTFPLDVCVPGAASCDMLRVPNLT